jgi:aspartate kinase
VVPDARRIGVLAYEETQEMAESGAKVLNAQAVEFAKAREIAIYARATQGPLPGPRPEADGTVVRRHSPRMPGTVVGVASERDLLLLESDAPPVPLLGLLDDCAVGGKQLHVFGGRATLVISRENLHDEPRLREILRDRLGSGTRLVDGLAAVSAIGAGINSTYANLRSGLDTLAAAGIIPAGTATSSFRITWLIPRERTQDAVRSLHAHFIEAAPAPVPLD